MKPVVFARALACASVVVAAPSEARFLQVDPVGYKDQINLYAYVFDDPLNRNDPSGLDAQLYWTSPTTVVMTVPYYVDTSPGGEAGFTSAGLQAQVAHDFSQTVSFNGANVHVTANAVQVDKPGPGVNSVHVYKTTDGVTQSGRAETNRVGGNDVRVGNSDDARVLSHELGGHAAGAGDQYKGGVDVNGQRLTADVPGDANRMHDLQANGANAQSMREILSAKTNTNTCAKDVHAANGGC